jgi:hypothetical protein
VRNIEQACFTTLNASINNMFDVSNDPKIQGWHAGMRVIDILDQLSTIYIYNQPTRAILNTKDTVFCSPYLAANAQEFLFHGIPKCAEAALLGRNPCTDPQLITNAIRLLLTTCLYTRPFKEWDCLLLTGQTRITLQTMLQEAFQWHLNTTTPTAGHHRYASALPYQNAFGALEEKDSNKESKETDATQVVALLYQSKSTASTAANAS